MFFTKTGLTWPFHPSWIPKISSWWWRGPCGPGSTCSPCTWYRSLFSGGPMHQWWTHPVMFSGGPVVPFQSCSVVAHAVMFSGGPVGLVQSWSVDPCSQVQWWTCGPIPVMISWPMQPGSVVARWTHSFMFSCGPKHSCSVLDPCS